MRRPNNGKQNLRRKVALASRERDLKYWKKELTKAIKIQTSETDISKPYTEEEKQLVIARNRKKIQCAKEEIKTLKLRIV